MLLSPCCDSQLYFIVPYTLTFLFISTFFDLKKRIVPNWLTLPSIIIGLAFHILFPTNGYYESLFFATLFSLALYKVGAWAGGDVKFFLALFSLQPIVDCFHPFSFVSVFLNAALLVVPLTLILVLTRLRDKKVVEKSKQAIIYGVKSTLASLPILFLLSLMFKNNLIDSVLYMLIFSTSVALFTVVRTHVLVKNVLVKDLKEGDISKRTIYLKKGKVMYWDPPSLSTIPKMVKSMDFSLFFGPKGGVVIADCLSAAGLTNKDIEDLKRRKVKSILVKVSLPFIPLLVLGYLLSLIGWSSVCVLVKQA